MIRIGNTHALRILLLGWSVVLHQLICSWECAGRILSICRSVMLYRLIGPKKICDWIKKMRVLFVLINEKTDIEGYYL